MSAETAGAEVIPVLSKADLVTAQQQQHWLDRLTGWGYQALSISRHDSVGLAALADRLSRGVAVLCGPSGVGKSSLLNALVPDLKLRTAAVSGKLQRGRHTTRHVELHDLPAGGLLADTPGFNRRSCLPIPGLWRNSSLKSASSWRPVCAADFATAGICRSRAAACSGNGSATPATWS